MFTYAQPPQKQAPRKMNQPASTGIPAAMKTQFEHMSGLSLDDVRVHYHSDKPARLQALAYTQGSNVYVAPGQERHLNHELGHIIQQRLGRVAATSRLGSVPLNDDPALEAQADNYAHMAAQGGTLPLQPQQPPDSGADGGVVQRCWAFSPARYRRATQTEVSEDAREQAADSAHHGSPSEILRAALIVDGDVYDPNEDGITNQAHHILETHNSKGQGILRLANIDPNSAINGVFLPTYETDDTGNATVHHGSHSPEYTQCINEAMESAQLEAIAIRFDSNLKIPYEDALQKTVSWRLDRIRRVLLTQNVPLNGSSDPTCNPKTGKPESIRDIFVREGLFEVRTPDKLLQGRRRW